MINTSENQRFDNICNDNNNNNNKVISIALLQTTYTCCFTALYILISSYFSFQPAFSDKPKIVQPGAFTRAAPTKEVKHSRRVSDAIANNYTPTARNLTSSYIYEILRRHGKYLMNAG